MTTFEIASYPANMLNKINSSLTKKIKTKFSLYTSLFLFLLVSLFSVEATANELLRNRSIQIYDEVVSLGFN